MGITVQFISIVHMALIVDKKLFTGLFSVDRGWLTMVVGLGDYHAYEGQTVVDSCCHYKLDCLVCIIQSGKKLGSSGKVR